MSYSSCSYKGSVNASPVSKSYDIGTLSESLLSTTSSAKPFAVEMAIATAVGALAILGGETKASSEDNHSYGLENITY